ncbi:MAG: hypothetical protein ACI9XU_002114 [Arenicella sp.]|jgi:hypothetical protein
MKKYHKKAAQTIVAVQLNLDTQGLHYKKWGANQFAKKDDWLANNNGSVYSIDNAAFERAYKLVSPGQYQKVSDIYAKLADNDGSIATLEGTTHYRKGDYLVYENPNQTGDAYAISSERFKDMYELVDDKN